MIFILLFLESSPRKMTIFGLILIFTYPALLLFFDYEQSWNFETLDYAGFWTVKGFLRNLIFNGFHPLIPWVAFMLFGFAFGKMNLSDPKFLKKSFWFSLLVFISIQFVSIIGAPIFVSSPDVQIFFLTDPMPPLPLYMFNGISFAVLITTASILLANHFPFSRIIASLNKTGQLALTFYVAHVVIGMAAIEFFGSQPLGSYSLGFSMIYALSFSLSCIIFAEIWLRKYRFGPLEFLMRKLLDRNKK